MTAFIVGASVIGTCSAGGARPATNAVLAPVAGLGAVRNWAQARRAGPVAEAAAGAEVVLGDPQ
jgi:hypothetical protein